MALQRIGVGRTAEVFLQNDGTIVKLFNTDFPEDIIQSEYILSDIVQKSDLPVPRVLEKITHNNRQGIVYSYHNGQSIRCEIQNKPWKLYALARLFASLHLQVHAKEVAELPSHKESIERAIGNTGLLDVNEKSFILSRLSELPEGETVCHGDFHPDNILLCSDGPIIIDWLTGMRGVPASDVARSMLLIKYSELPKEIGSAARFMLACFRNIFFNSYLRAYTKQSPVSHQEIRRWFLPILAARLDENLPPQEEKRFLAMIRTTITMDS